MELYKVILADDEAEVRLGMRKRVPWVSCGFEIVGDAENGQEALDLCETLMPDLVVTDIKMPYMDGLALVRRLKKKYPSVKTVIITGFEDFEYAKEAIELGVTQYISKPVNVNEFTQILQTLKADMDEEFLARRDMERLREHFFASRPILQENCLVSLIEGRLAGAQAFNMAKSLDMDILLGSCVVACCRLDISGRQEDPAYAGMLSLLIKQLILDRLTGRFSCFSTIYTNFIVTVISLKQKSVSALLPLLDESCVLARRYHELNVSMGLGYVCEEPEELHRSYMGARAALDYRFMLGTGHTIFIQDIEPAQTLVLGLSESDEQALRSAIRLGDEPQISTHIRALLSRCEDERIPYAQVQVYVFSILSCIYKLSNTYEMNADILLERGVTPARKLASFDSLEQVRQWLVSLCLTVAVHLRNMRQNASGTLIQTARAYAQEHYWNQDFSVDNMCRELHISASYFSNLFKKETGQSFMNYLTDIRMGHAKRLLSETDMMTYLIAEKVGYSDANYFSYAFKKHCGLSPSKYRGSFE